MCIHIYIYMALCQIVCTHFILVTQNCPLGPNGPGTHGACPNGPPWALMDRALMGRALMGPPWALMVVALTGQALMGPLVPHGSPWALMGRTLAGRAPMGWPLMGTLGPHGPGPNGSQTQLCVSNMYICLTKQTQIRVHTIRHGAIYIYINQNQNKEKKQNIYI